MGRVLLDTNILINHLGDIEPLPDSHDEFLISVLTEFELLRFPGLSIQEERQIRAFIQTLRVVPVTETIAIRAAELGRIHRIGSVDLLLAATALILEMPFITKNIRDFRKISQLKIQTKI